MSRGPKLKIGLFDPHVDRFDLGKRWEKWLERFERDLKYNGVDSSLAVNSEKSQMAIARHHYVTPPLSSGTPPFLWSTPFLYFLEPPEIFSHGARSRTNTHNLCR